MGKLLRAIKIIFRVLLAVLVGGLLVYNVYTMVARSFFGIGMPKLFGYAGATVASGSMADTINTGDFIIIREEEEYAVGDIITFYDDIKLSYTTHRIIAVSDGEYYTKGDANNAQDEFGVSYAAVVGKVVGVWRGFGFFVSFLQSPLGLFAVAACGIDLWLVPEIVTEVIRKTKNGKET